jgi:hypothetical protein
LSCDSDDKPEELLDIDNDDASLDLGQVKESFTQKQIDQAKKGLLSGRSMAQLGIDPEDLNVGDVHETKQPQDEGRKKMLPRTYSQAMNEEHRPEGEVRMARKGLISRKTMANLRKNIVDMDVDNEANFDDDDEGEVKVDKSRSTPDDMESSARKGPLTRNGSVVSFSDGIQSSWHDVDDDAESESGDQVMVEPLVDADKEKEASVDYDGEDKDALIFSSNELKEHHQRQDILSEGQYYLGISMLVSVIGAVLVLL